MRLYSKKKNSVKIFSAMTIFVALLFVISQQITAKKDEGIIVATVNGEKISQSEITQKLRNIFDGQGDNVKIPEIKNLPREVLDILIKETYLDKELSKLAKRSNVINDKKVKERILASESKILRQAYIAAEVAKEVTDQRVSEKYTEISSELAGKKEYLVFHIVVKSEAEAKAVRKKIWGERSAARFANAAKRYSLDKESASRGGELGFVLEDNMIQEISDMVVNLKKDEVSGPIETKFGWHLVKFTDVKDAKPLPFDSVKENIREQLERDQINEIEAGIVKDVKVEILITPEEKSLESPAAVEKIQESDEEQDEESKAEEEKAGK